MQCPQCHTSIISKDTVCPHCGMPLNRRTFYRTIIITLVAIGLVIIYTNNRKSGNIASKFTEYSSNTETINTDSLQAQKMIALWNANQKEPSYVIARSLDSLNPHYPTALYIIAVQTFENGQKQEALTLFKKLYSHSEGSAGVLQWIKKIELENSEHDELDTYASEHFFLRYEGTKIYPFTDSILAIMETHYTTLSLALKSYPHDRFEVIVYHDPKFSGLQALPDWAAASYNGKIRIPYQLIEQLPSSSPLLIHELTHAFLHQINPQLPGWIHEGVAQYFQKKRLDSLLIQNNTWPTIEALQKPFSGITDKKDARLAYAISQELISTLIARAYIETLPQFLTTYQSASPDVAIKKQYDITIEKLYSQSKLRWRTSP